VHVLAIRREFRLRVISDRRFAQQPRAEKPDEQRTHTLSPYDARTRRLPPSAARQTSTRAVYTRVRGSEIVMRFVGDSRSDLCAPVEQRRPMNYYYRY